MGRAQLISPEPDAAHRTSVSLKHKGLAKTILQFVSFIKCRKKMYLLQVEMLLIYCDIIEMIAERWKTFRNIKNRILNEELQENILIILNILKVDPKSKVSIKISEQQQRDVGNEIKRLNAIIQLANLLQIDNSIKSDPDVKTSIEKAKSAVFTIYAFDEDEAFSSLKALQTSLKNNTHILKMERQMIVRSLGVQAGTWYKCPNGHFYTIGNCGQAVQQSRCPDCGAVIGGIAYRLADNNVRIAAPNL